MAQLLSNPIALLAGVALTALSACASNEAVVASSDTVSAAPKNTLLLERMTRGLITAPDEFAVVTRRPLEMPGMVSELPAPDPNKRSTRIPNPTEDARAALARGWGGQILPANTRDNAQPSGPSAVEAAMLSAIGAGDPNIGQTLAADQAAVATADRAYVLDRVFPALATMRNGASAHALDVEAEQARLTALYPNGTGTVPAVSTTPTLSAPVVSTVTAPQYITVPLDQSIVSAPQIMPAPVVEAAPLILNPVISQPASVAPAATTVPTFGSAPVTVRETESGLIYIE